MGTFIGHLIPGVIFIFLGFWWSFLSTFRYIERRNGNLRNNKIYDNYSMQVFCGPAWLQKLPIESIFKFLLSIFGILFEITTGLIITQSDSSLFNQTFTEMSRSGYHKRQIESAEAYTWTIGSDSLQHATMYSAFLIGSIVEILTHYKVHLPHRLDYICGILSFSVEALLFKFHSHGVDEIDVLMHTLLILAIYGCAVSSMLEYAKPNQIIFTYGRAVFTFLQGTWFCEASFILYPPVKSLENRWDPNNQMHLMFITVSFIWNFLFIFISLLLQFIILNFFTKKHSSTNECFDEPFISKRIKTSNHKKLNNLSDDEIDDIRL